MSPRPQASHSGPEVAAALAARLLAGAGVQIGRLVDPSALPAQVRQLDAADGDQALATVADGSLDFIIDNPFLDGGVLGLATLERQLPKLAPGGALLYVFDGVGADVLPQVLDLHDRAGVAFDVEFVWQQAEALTVVLRKRGAADDELSRQIDELRERLDRADQVIADLEGSLSWRVTAPLRGAKRALSHSRRPRRIVTPREAVPLRIAIDDYGGKSIGLADALTKAGHEVGVEGPADVFLIDLDPPLFGYRERIDRHRAMGAKVLLYPHGVAPALEYDALYEPYEHVDARLVIGPGHAEFLRRIEYPHPAYAIGWSLCEPRPFRPAPELRRVLFAPTHPSGAGDLPEALRENNARAYRQLIDGPWELTVRHIGALEQNGLWPVDGVTYVQGGQGIAYGEIDSVDAVVAGDGTFPALAIARGAPTVICAQGFPAFYGLPGEEPPPLRLQSRYRDFVRYPFDGDDGPLPEVLHAAARSEAPILQWKRRFVGDPLDAEAVGGLVERIVRGAAGPPPLDRARERVILGFADEVLGRPELLRRVAPAADTTLVLWAPGVFPEVAEAMVTEATAGLDGLPHILPLSVAPSDANDRALAERADLLLSDWPTSGRVGALDRLA